MWRPTSSRSHEGYIDKAYNEKFTSYNARWDALGVLQQIAGLTDAEYLTDKTLDHLAPVDKVFVKQGTDVKINVTKRAYLYKHTPWTGLSPHHPVSVKFELTFPKTS